MVNEFEGELVTDRASPDLGKNRKNGWKDLGLPRGPNLNRRVCPAGIADLLAPCKCPLHRHRLAADQESMGRQEMKMKGRRKTPNPFGAFRKRTITAREFTRALASIAADVPTLYRVWIKHELDPGFREELMLAVSRVNDCKYCSWAHYEWANLEGIPEEDLAQVEQMDPDHFDRKKWLAISYVRELVAVRFGPVSRGPDAADAGALHRSGNQGNYSRIQSDGRRQSGREHL